MLYIRIFFLLIAFISSSKHRINSYWTPHSLLMEVFSYNVLHSYPITCLKMHTCDQFYYSKDKDVALAPSLPHTTERNIVVDPNSDSDGGQYRPEGRNHPIINSLRRAVFNTGSRSDPQCRENNLSDSRTQASRKVVGPAKWIRPFKRDELFHNFAVEASAGTLTAADLSKGLWLFTRLKLRVSEVSNPADLQAVMRRLGELAPTMMNMTEVQRVVGSLCKLEVRWQVMPPQLQQRYLDTLSVVRSPAMQDIACNVGDSDGEGENSQLGALAVTVWTLGQLGARLVELPRECREAIHYRLLTAESSSTLGLSGQTRAMLASGLSRIGATARATSAWKSAQHNSATNEFYDGDSSSAIFSITSDTAAGTRSDSFSANPYYNSTSITTRVKTNEVSEKSNFSPSKMTLSQSHLAISNVLPDDFAGYLVGVGTNGSMPLQLQEMCAIVNSLAVMQVRWSDLSLVSRRGLIEQLLSHAAHLPERELSNTLWALGSMRIPLSASVSSSPIVDIDTSLASLSGILMDRLGARAHRLAAYDLESALTGLVTGGVDRFDLLRAGSWQLLQARAVELIHKEPLETYRAKSAHTQFLTNTLTAVARLSARSGLSVTDELRQTLQNHLLDNLHLLAGDQYAVSLVSLASVGCKREHFSDRQLCRLTAVLSRVLLSLQPRTVAVILIALQQIGLRWVPDLTSESRSVEGGTLVEPLGWRVLLFLRSRSGDVLEKDMSRALLALGLMQAKWLGVQSEHYFGANSTSVAEVDTRVNNTLLTNPNLSQKVRGRILSRWGCLTRFSSMKNLGLSLWSLVEMGTAWSDLSNATVSAVMSALTERLNKLNSEVTGTNTNGKGAAEMGMIVSGLCQIGAMSSFSSHAQYRSKVYEHLGAALLVCAVKAAVQESAPGTRAMLVHFVRKLVSVRSIPADVSKNSTNLDARNLDVEVPESDPRPSETQYSVPECEWGVLTCGEVSKELRAIAATASTKILAECLEYDGDSNIYS